MENEFDVELRRRELLKKLEDIRDIDLYSGEKQTKQQEKEKYRRLMVFEVYKYLTNNDLNEAEYIMYIDALSKGYLESKKGNKAIRFKIQNIKDWIEYVKLI